jgi:hypothetical protein
MNLNAEINQILASLNAVYPNGYDIGIHFSRFEELGLLNHELSREVADMLLVNDFIEPFPLGSKGTSMFRITGKGMEAHKNGGYKLGIKKNKAILSSLDKIKLEKYEHLLLTLSKLVKKQRSIYFISIAGIIIAVIQLILLFRK